MKNRFKILLFIFSTLLPFISYANDENLTFLHYTNQDGLPSSYVKSICQDQYGFIWIASRSSVCRFDGKHFQTFQAIDEEGVGHDLWCKKFFTYNDSLLIAQTTDDKYYTFDFALEEFKPFTLLNEIGNILSLEPSADGFWIFGEELMFLDIKRNQILNFNKKIDFANLKEDVKVVNLREKYNKLVALTNQNTILIFDLKLKLQRDFSLPEKLNSVDVEKMYIDNNNYVWLGGNNNGIYCVNLANGHSVYFSNQGKGNRYLPHNMVHCINEDNTGRIWIGTENGLCIWSPYSESFSYYQYDINKPQGLNTNPIYDVFRDKTGNMWLGTYFGGINLWNNNPEFFKIWQSGTGDIHIGGNAVSCIQEDQEGNIWIGTEDMGVNKYDAKTGKISKFISSKNNNGLSFNNVHCLLFETDKRLWIGTYTGGISILNTQTNKFEYINTNNYPVLPSDNIYHLLKSGDSIFIATSAGTAVYHISTKKMSLFQPNIFNGIQVEYMYEGNGKIWFSSVSGVYFSDKRESTFTKFYRVAFLKNINFVKTDSKNRVWIGDCRQGLCCFDQEKDTTILYNEKNGFPFSWIFSMEEGTDGSFWVSGDKGLVNFTPGQKDIKLFNRESDIPFDQFNFRASFKDKSGNIYFGGNNGMVSFNEAAKYERPTNLKVVFRGMQLFNQPLVPGNSSPLKQSLNVLPEVHLKYKQNVFTIEYSGLNFQNSGKCQYAYYLEDFEKNWNYVGTRDFASYTNLSPGEYIFHVKTIANETESTSTPSTLRIIVEPPFWLSNWGYFIYFIIVVLALLAFFLVATKIQRSKAEAEMERREREYATNLNNFKLEFFTNVSHELRTPLTLIVGPLVRVLQEEKLSPALSKKMKGIKNNAHRLLTLINQLLEFRKIESGKEILKVSQHNISTLLDDIEDSFAESAIVKGINLVFDKPDSDETIWIDFQKFENIVINLLSNALKYTGEGGKVTLELRLSSSNQILTVKVSDTGKGIDRERLNKIFDRFYQEDNSESQVPGSGIGLAFVTSLVKLHRGKIEVESVIGKGSVFTLKIPVSRKDYKDNEIVFGNTQFVPEIDPMDDIKSFPEHHDEMGLFSKNPTVLVIDDNTELLDFVSEILKGDYKIITASNGIDGLAKIEETLPDLIISDVMMPGVDGFALCRKLKSDIKTSHIPVILLTAKSGEDNEFEGLQTGADYYIEKPFFPHILNKIVENILSTRKNLIERFKSDLNMLPSEMAYSESDKELIDKITKLIKQNIDLPDMDVTFLVNKIGISRSLLHVKLKKLTDCSATEFIRSIRLREAVKLIAEGKCNISEAAYQTGFSSPAYFSRRFKEYFGMNPKSYFEK